MPTDGPTASRSSQPQVSILLCVYNGERFLDATLTAVFGQSFQDFELIVVDDGSTDASREVLERYRNDPRIRVTHQENRGTAGALEIGLQSVRGDYVAFLDQDDLWEPEYLSRQVEELSLRPGKDMIFCGFQLIDENGQETGLTSRPPHSAVSFSSLLVDFVVGGTSNLVLRRNAIERAGGMDLEFRRMYNVDLCLRVALLAPDNIAFLPQHLMRYRRHSGQLSRDVHGMADEWKRLVHKLETRAPRQVAAVRNRAYSNHYRYLSRLCYEAGNYAAALKFLWSALGSAPLVFVGDVRNWVTAVASLSGLTFPKKLHSALERLAGYRRSATGVLI